MLIHCPFSPTACASSEPPGHKGLNLRLGVKVEEKLTMMIRIFVTIFEQKDHISDIAYRILVCQNLALFSKQNSFPAIPQIILKSLSKAFILIMNVLKTNFFFVQVRKFPLCFQLSNAELE